MKTLIQKLLRESLLSERLTNVDDDVDMIYEKYFSYDIDEVNRTGRINDTLFLQSKTDTSILKSKEAIEAHKKNPCVLYINNHMHGGNYYNPKNSTISVSVNDNVLDFVKTDADGIIDKALGFLRNQPEQMKRFKQEFTEERIKGSIHHELSHWIDDTINNGHISKRINRQIKYNTRNIGGIPVNATKMEIQAQIHNIKQLYNKYRDDWDGLTFDELIDLSPVLSVVYNSLYGKIKNKWIRDVKTRMYR